MAQEKQHLTTEQLSTFLDGEGLAEEQAQWEAHLSTCPQCQQALANLRQTVSLLHALPQPTLPRSFLLPIDTLPDKTNEEEAQPKAAAPTPIRPSHRRTLNPYVRGVLRTISTLAAVIGFIFFLSGIGFLNIHGGGTSSTTGSSTMSSLNNDGAEPVAGTTNGAKTPSFDGTLTPAPSATAIQAVQPRTTDTHSSSSNSPDQTNQPSKPTLFLFDLSTTDDRLGLGFLLVLFGIMGIILFKRPKRVNGS